jgi:lipid-binding SYLF domain-containing protein
MTKQLVTCLMVVALTIVPALGGETKKQQKQQEVRQMADETLGRLYKAEPSAKEAISRAAGYAVFSNVGVKIMVAGSGNGKGIAVNNKNKQETFMKMLEIQGGLGFGVKKFRIVFVFGTEGALNSFVESGWQLGGQTSVAAKAGDTGAAMAGAIAAAPGVWMYQLTDSGVALEITAKGTKYYKDGDLN